LVSDGTATALRMMSACSEVIERFYVGGWGLGPGAGQSSDEPLDDLLQFFERSAAALGVLDEAPAGDVEAAAQRRQRRSDIVERGPAWRAHQRVRDLVLAKAVQIEMEIDVGQTARPDRRGHGVGMAQRVGFDHRDPVLPDERGLAW